MDMMSTILALLYEISALLLIPVVVLLLILFVVSLVGIGVHSAESILRWRNGDNLRTLKKILQELDGVGSTEEVKKKLNTVQAVGYVGRLVNDLRSGHSLARLHHTLDDIEHHIERKVARSTLLTRAGPMLGLMGTLIPMGPALKLLANGDIEGLSEKLIIAFSTTVIGLAVGGIALVISATRRRWYSADLRTCDSLLRLQRKGQRS